MFSRDQYELLDFGNGVKIERFGDRVVARQSPSVARFDLQRGLRHYSVDSVFVSDTNLMRGHAKGWSGSVDGPWQLVHDKIHLELRATPTGQVGLFPEQANNWQWISEHSKQLEGKRAINLFAYTGGSTLALAKAGAEVVHVDAASSVVTWARENARRSGLGDAPIRWIVEDAMKFLNREQKRGNLYDVFVADPPSFGRGTKNEIWKIDRDLDKLVAAASKLCPNPSMMILSCHSPAIDSRELARLVRRHVKVPANSIIENFQFELRTADNRKLPSGECARFVIEK